MSPIPIDITIGFTLLPLVVLATFSFVLVKRSRSLSWVVVVMAGWTIFTAAMAYSGLLAEFTSFPPWIPILVLAQLAFVFWLGWYSHWSDLLAKIPQYILVGLQCFRIPVELLLATLAARKLLAIEMTYNGRNFDVLEGITAFALAILLKRCGENYLRHSVLVWNLIGLSLVTVVISHGMLSVSYPQLFHYLSMTTYLIA
jgi:hypothetical protein